MYGNVEMPDSYSGGALWFELQSLAVAAVSSGNTVWNVDCQCRGAGDTVDSTWGTAQTWTTTYTTANVLRDTDAASLVTCNGTCVARDHVFWRATLASHTLSNADAADVRVVGVDFRRRIARLVVDPGIVRHRGKIEASVGNARAFLAVQREHGSFDRYLWSFVGNRPIQGRRAALSDVPARTAESDALSKDLRARGFKFVGSTIVYAFMQAVGLVNDHVAGCFREPEVRRPGGGRLPRKGA